MSLIYAPSQCPLSTPYTCASRALSECLKFDSAGMLRSDASPQNSKQGQVVER